MKKTVLREYARLIVRCGVNVQKGQEVIVYADLDQPEFVQMVVEEAYKAKAKKVTVEWSYQPLTKVHTRYRSVTTMGTVEEWQKAKLQHEVDVVPCRILYDTPDGRMHLFCKVRVLYGEPMPAAQFAMEGRRDTKKLRANKQALLEAWEKMGA